MDHKDRNDTHQPPAIGRRARPLPIWGRSLRFVLVAELMAHPGPVSVAELVAFVEASGYPLKGRASKIISDALRWEVRRGRVTRIRRGVYHYRSAPPTTTRRIRRFAQQSRAWIDAVLAGTAPPPTPPDERNPITMRPIRPHHPPWFNTAWLWTT